MTKSVQYTGHFSSFEKISNPKWRKKILDTFLHLRNVIIWHPKLKERIEPATPLTEWPLKELTCGGPDHAQSTPRTFTGGRVGVPGPLFVLGPFKYWCLQDTAIKTVVPCSVLFGRVSGSYKLLSAFNSLKCIGSGLLYAFLCLRGKRLLCLGSSCAFVGSGHLNKV